MILFAAVAFMRVDLALNLLTALYVLTVALIVLEGRDHPHRNRRRSNRLPSASAWLYSLRIHRKIGMRPLASLPLE